MPDQPAAVPAAAAPTTALPTASTTGSSTAPSTADILAIVDRLEALVRGTRVSEIEVEASGVGVTLRTPAAVPGPMRPAPTADAFASAVSGPAPAPGDPAGPGASAGPASTPAAGSPGLHGGPATATQPALHAILAPLTGTWYETPSPGAAPYVRAGDEVATGQVVGLIEAMKLFNEIKSDASGRIVRVLVEHGSLVKAKQALLEVERT